MLGLSSFSAFLLGLGTLYFFLYHRQLRRSRPDEPPAIAAPGLPFLGHVLGMGIQGGCYLRQLGLRLHKESPGTGIFTLPVPMSRIYLVTDPTLAVAVQRATRTMSFTPIAPEVTRRILGFDDATMRIIRPENVTVASSPTKTATTGAMSMIDEQKYDESHGFMADAHDLIYIYLMPGDRLNAFVLGASTGFVGQVNAYASRMASESGPGSGSGSSPAVVNLLGWTNTFVTAATSQFLYGPHNLMAKDPTLEQTFWDFVHGLGRLLIVGDRAPDSLIASVLGGRPLEAREQLVAGFVQWLESGEKGNDFIERRKALGDRYGWETDGLARSELAFLFATIINTTVASFWMVLRLFADPALLQTVREELGNSDTLSMEHIRNGCPMLHAVFQEVLRLASNNMSSRLVLTDTKLADRYFLRAGSVVQVSAGVIHADSALWGENVDSFNPSRFLKSSTASSSAAATKRHPAVFRAFSGGKTLCPGRHFTEGETLAYVAAVVQLFKIKDTKKGLPPGTPPQVPPHNDRVMPMHLLKPTDKDLPRVRLRLRQPGKTLQVVA